MVKMLAVISPAKTLDFETESPIDLRSQYRFVDESHTLMKTLSQLDAEQIQSLMKLSAKLGQLNYERNQQWQPKMTPQNSKQALFAFKGDVYTGLSAETLTTDQILFAQDKVRILSGLYGLLKPLDAIQPYRLEMGTALANERGKNLYGFWGSQITDLLNEDIKQTGADALINLASQEYFKAVKPSALNVPVITPIFKDEKNGQYKIISFFAKKARGLMVRYLLEMKPESLDALKRFDYSGYRFCETESDATQWVFKRQEQS